MNNRYLYRAKYHFNGDTSTLNKFVYGYYWEYKDKHYINCNMNNVRIIPETLGQCSTYSDVNGNLIFEGDLLKVWFYYDKDDLGSENNYWNAIVKYIDNYLQIYIEDDVIREYEFYRFERMKIIGNIHDEK